MNGASDTMSGTASPTGSTMARTVGVWRVRGAGVLVPVVVLADRTAFGKPQFLVTPIEGDRSTWVSAEAVAIAPLADI